METYWLYAYLAVGVVLFMGFWRWVSMGDEDDAFISALLLFLWPMAVVLGLLYFALEAIELTFKSLKKIAKIGVKK